ncbi:hypothetical protein LCGC14_3163010, partial [marine sediment metagenome]
MPTVTYAYTDYGGAYRFTQFPLVAEDWATLIAGEGNQLTATSVLYIQASNLTDKWTRLMRGIGTFDTSGIDGDAIITE